MPSLRTAEVTSYSTHWLAATLPTLATGEPPIDGAVLQVMPLSDLVVSDAL